MKCFYHIDLDGKCSGAIVRKYYGDKCEYIPYYLKDFPYDSIEKDEHIILVDCSCDFNKLLEITKNIVWIDHHKTAIDEYQHLNLAGIRRDGTAACELTWEYYYSDIKMPFIIRLLGDYDVWKFEYGNMTNQMQTGIRLYDHEVESDNWKKWFQNSHRHMDVLGEGKIALKYRDNYYAGLIKSISYFADFEEYRAVCCNAPSASSQLFDTVEGEYDIMIMYSHDGLEWHVSLRSKEGKDIDVGAIAKKYGGGGHKYASGFRCSELPFKRID